jgi:hypothetical protein
MRKNMLITGKASDDKESFEFTVERFVTGGVLLSIHYSGDGRENVTGAGVWPTIEKAKEIAEKTAGKLLHGATVSWRHGKAETEAQR